MKASLKEVDGVSGGLSSLHIARRMNGEKEGRGVVSKEREQRKWNAPTVAHSNAVESKLGSIGYRRYLAGKGGHFPSRRMELKGKRENGREF